MSAPAPPVALANQVSAIHANTLYTFQPEAFQSINIANNSQWNSLQMGIAVNGSQAVVAQSAGSDCLFIVGGRANSSQQSFPGLQKYDFGSNSWQALAPETSVAQNRVQHGAAYLSSTKSILLYGGSQDNSYTASTQTFTIGTEEPFVMKSYPPGAPAVQNPILLPYNGTHALMAGGGASLEQIWLFSEASGWHMMTTTVPGGVADASKVQAALTTDNSGNKQLQLFDMSSSPNKVTNIALSNQFHKRENVPIVERDNSAPTASRNGFSLAQDGSMVVISGGTSDKTAGPLAVFDSSKSGWQDPSSIFGAAQAASQGSVPQNGHSADPQKGGNGDSSAPAASGAATASSGTPASSGAVSASASQAASSGASAASASAVSSAASGASSGAASATNSAGATGTGSAAASSGAASSGAAASGAGASGAAGASGTAAAAAAASASAAAAAAAATGSDAGGAGANSTSVILAAVLGSFFGIAAIFLIALLLVRYRRQKTKQEEAQRQEALNEKRAESPASTIGSIHAPGYGSRNKSPFENGQTPQISRPTLEPQTQAEDLAPPRKLGGDGWSPYSQSNDTVENLYPSAGGGPQGMNRMSNSHSHLAGAAIGGAALGAAAGVGFAAAAHSRNTQYTVDSSYTIDSPISSTAPGAQDPAYVAPLHIRASSHGQLETARPFSDASTNNRDTFRRSFSGQGSWDQSNFSEHDSTSSAGYDRPVRPASSVYFDRASSVYPTALSPTAMENFPPVPAIPRPGTSGVGADTGMRSIISTDFGAGPSYGQTFPDSTARRVPPGSEPRSAGSGTGHSSEKDLSWFNMNQNSA